MLDEPRSRLPHYSKTILWLLLDQWFVLAMGIVIIIASQVQVPAAHQAMKKTVVTYVSVSIVFFITGCTLPTRVLIDNYSRWKIHLFVQIQCFLMTSAIIFGIVSACATNRSFMDPGLLVGMIIGGCLPTTISSNVVMTRQAHGNQALTVVESTIGNFIGPFVSPVLVQMYVSAGAWYTKFLPSSGSNYNEIYRRIFKQLGLSIYLPMVVGQLVQHLFPNPTKKVFGEWKLNKLGSFALLAILWSTFDQAFESGAFSSVKADNKIFIVFISIAYFLIWFTVSFLLSILWLPKEDTISVCYCVPAKSIAIGVPLSSVLFVGLSNTQESKLQIPMVIFQGIQIASASLMTIPFRRWVRTEEEASQVKIGNAEKGSSYLSEPPRAPQDAQEEGGDYALRAFSSH
jgi:solute carrier family 10 (sodium/bile acid cotransporter), member 7